MYLRGEGGAKDYEIAASWFRKAANQGHASSQAILGMMYESGAGVPQDDISAHLWFDLAAASGANEAAELRDRVAARMTSVQIAQAQKLAGEWKPRK
jgi:TPR repeat protein